MCSFFFFKQKTAYEMRISDWSSDVCSSDLHQPARRRDEHIDAPFERLDLIAHLNTADQQRHRKLVIFAVILEILGDLRGKFPRRLEDQRARHARARSEEHTSELQSLMRISYAVFCLKNQNTKT